MDNFSMIDFNYFDISIGVIVLILGIKGFINGFIKEFFGLLGLIGGVYFASRLSPEAAHFIDTNFLHLENTSLLKLLGFLAILIIIWLSATILGAIFHKLSSKNTPSFINRLLGFIAGGSKYFLIFALIVTALSNVSLVRDKLEKYTQNSVLYPYLKSAGSSIINLNASDIKIKTSNSSDLLKNTADSNESNSTTKGQ